MGGDNSWASTTELINRSSCCNEGLPPTKPNCTKFIGDILIFPKVLKQCRAEKLDNNS